MTELATTRQELAKILDPLRGQKRLGFVPTMGALHAGHEALLDQARAAADVVVMSLFVNPTQFNDQTDFTAYPRDLDGDLRLAERAGVDVCFVPEVAELYADAHVVVEPGPLGAILEGAFREGHFQGVATVVVKLFGIVAPHFAVFGEKDYQQLAIIRSVTSALFLGVEIRAGKTVREPDGLALSSRNRRLSPTEREAASVLYLALQDGARLAHRGALPVALEQAMAGIIAAERLADLDYAVVRAADSLEEIDTCAGELRLLVAARFGDVRLIDNVGVTC